MKKLSSFFRYVSFRRRVVLITCLSLFLPTVVFGTILARNLWRGKTNEILAQNQRLLADSAEKIWELYSANVSKAVYIINNQRLTSILADEKEKSLTKTWDDYRLLDDILGALEVYGSQKSISIYTLNKSLYSSRYIAAVDKLDSGVRDKLLEADYPVVYWRHRWAGAGETPYVLLYWKLVSINKPLAFIEMKIPFDRVLACLTPELPEEGFVVYETETDGRYIHTSRPLDGFDKALEDYETTGFAGDFYALRQPLGINSDALLYFLPRNRVNADLRSITSPIALAVAALSISLMIIYILASSKALTGRLDKLLVKINRDIEQYILGGTDTVISGGDEFAVIEKRYNELIKRVCEYYREISNLEMDLLQASVNPHFLCNALGALKWYSEDEKFNDVIDGLINYYRNVLGHGERVIPLRMELDCLAQYMDIQKFVYKCGFTYSITAGEQSARTDTGGRTILKNLLLPVVENAFYHGVRPKGGNGRVDISCEERQGKLVIQISDDGPGMDERTREDLLTGKNRAYYKGYGMVNVRKRLAAFYGEDASMDVNSRPGGGTAVTLTLPITSCGE